MKGSEKEKKPKESLMFEIIANRISYIKLVTSVLRSFISNKNMEGTRAILLF